MPGVGVPDDKLPEFTDEVENRTVVAGREAILSCHVESLGSYKVGVMCLTLVMVQTLSGYCNIVAKHDKSK